MQPTKISLDDEKHLRVRWDDGAECVFALAVLRRSCPCATCTTDAQNRSAGYIPLFSRDALSLEAIDPLGNYALQFRWKDGHHTGIYTYEYLRSLCPEHDAPEEVR